MTTRLAWLAACAAVTVVVAGEPASVAAQPVYYPGSYPGSPAVLPPYEILTIVRSVGLEPLGRPVRSGETYGLRAVNPAGQVVRVVVHARMGRILRVVPSPRAAGLIPPNPIPSVPSGSMVPDGYGPNSRITAYPPETSEVPFAERSSATAPVRSAKVSPPPSPPPLPRARPTPLPLPQEADAAAGPAASAPAPAPAAENPSAILE